MACQKMCLQHHIIDKCGCGDVGLPMLPRFKGKVPLCRNDEDMPNECMFNATQKCLDTLLALNSRIKCARSTKASLTKNTTALESCYCFPPCDEFTYDVSYSLSKWPASGYEGDAAYFDVFGIVKFNDRFNTSKLQDKFKLMTEYFNVNDREETMKNFARLNVYIADSNVVKTQESEDYTRNQLVSDIGGQLGLWVGISLITLTEVLELAIQVFRYMTSSSYRSVPRNEPYVNNNMNNHVPSRSAMSDTKLWHREQVGVTDDSDAHSTMSKMSTEQHHSSFFKLWGQKVYW